MKRYGVRPSVSLSHQLATSAACGVFRVELQASIDSVGRSVVTAPQHGAAARRSAANAGSATSTAELTKLNTDLIAAYLEGCGLSSQTSVRKYNL